MNIYRVQFQNETIFYKEVEVAAPHYQDAINIALQEIEAEGFRAKDVLGCIFRENIP